MPVRNDEGTIRALLDRGSNRQLTAGTCESRIRHAADYIGEAIKEQIRSEHP